MTFGRAWGGVLVLLTAGAVAACSRSPSSPTGQVDITVQNFEGTLMEGEAQVFPFEVTLEGGVTVVLRNAFQPATSLQVTLGMGVGTWDGESCTLVDKSDEAVFNTVITGRALVGSYCATVYDVGNIGPNPVEYAVEVRHY